MNSSEFRIDIFLDGKKLVPHEMSNRRFISLGFTPLTVIQDFPPTEVNRSICIFVGVSSIPAQSKRAEILFDQCPVIKEASRSSSSDYLNFLHEFWPRTRITA